MGLLRTQQQTKNSSLNTKENVAGDVNIPSIFTTYHGVETNSAIVGIDNTNRAISVVVKPMPGAGLIDDIQVDGESVVSDRIAHISIAPVIAEESNRAQRAEGALQNALTDTIEIVAGLKTDLQTAISEEKVARKAADTNLQHSIDSESATRVEADTLLQNKLTSEKADRQAADATLQLNINIERQLRTTAINKLQGDIIAEVTRATGAESNLSAGISAEAERAMAAEESLQTALVTEKNTRSDEDAAIRAEILAENVARAAGDNSLSSAIAAETVRASSAEESLQNALNTAIEVEDAQIAAVETTLGAQIATLSHNINTEIARREDGDAANSRAITAEVTKARAAESALSNRITAEVSDRAAAVAEVQQALTTTASTLEAAISTVATNLATTNTTVATEITNRATADQALQSQIDAIESRSDVVDVVTNKVALDNYDISKLSENDVIKVLADETWNNATTYYRLVSRSWSFIGAVGPFFTKAEIEQREAAIETKITAEYARASGVEVTLGNNIAAEASARATAINTLSTEINQRLDDMTNEYLEKLKYCNLKLINTTITRIKDFNNITYYDTNLIEIGNTFTEVTLNFSYSKLPVGAYLHILEEVIPAWTETTEELEGEVQKIYRPVTEYTIRNLSSQVNFPISVSLLSDYDGSVTQHDTGVKVVNRIYYGVGKPKDDAIDWATWFSSQIQADRLNSALADGFLTNLALNVSALDDYIYYICPTNYGTPMFTITPSQFRGGISKISSISYTNSYNETIEYDIWRSDNAGLGGVTLIVEKQ